MDCRSICRLVELSELRPMLEQSRLYGIARPKSFKRQASNDSPFGVAQCLLPISFRDTRNFDGATASSPTLFQVYRSTTGAQGAFNLYRIGRVVASFIRRRTI
jgi:hypothetical protein